jgi:O-antigen ligase
MNFFFTAVDRVGFYLLTCCVAFAPIPFGSNSDGFAGLLGVALTVALIGTFAAPQPDPGVHRLHTAVIALALVIALWSVAQVVSFHGASWSSSVWRTVGELIGETHDAIAVARYQPLYSLGHVLLPFAAFLCALVYVRDTARYTAFLNILITVGFIVTVVCLAQYRYAPDMLLWAEKQHYLWSFSGSFVNPNTAATYLGVVMLMALSAALSHVERAGGMRVLLGPHRGLTESAPVRWGALLAYLSAALVFFIALMLTQSRAGIMASLAGAAVLTGAFAYLAVRRRSSLLTALGFGALVLCGAALLVHFYIERLRHRLEIEGFVDEGRACTYEATWRAVQEHFWQGTGLGTFQDIFPRYRLLQCGLDGHWNMAHNLFLEGMLSLGAVVFVLCCLIVYTFLLHAYARGVRKRRQMRFVPLSCLGILVILTLHSLVDFSMQIPGLAVFAGSVLGAGAAVSLEPPGARSRQQRSAVAMASGRAARARAWAGSA